MTEAPFRAVSADSHVNPPAEMWARVPAGGVPRPGAAVERTDDGDFEVFEGQRRPIMALRRPRPAAVPRSTP